VIKQDPLEVNQANITNPTLMMQDNSDPLTDLNNIVNNTIDAPEEQKVDEKL